MDKILGEYMIICKNNLQKQSFLIMSFMESNHGCLSMNRVLALSELQLIMLVGIVLVV